MGMLLVFTAVVGYLMDTYQHYTASAIAASVLLRSLLGALFPLVTPGLFSKIGAAWGSSIFAFLALLCMPLPFLFYVSPFVEYCQILVFLTLRIKTASWSANTIEFPSGSRLRSRADAGREGSGKPTRDARDAREESTIFSLELFTRYKYNRAQRLLKQFRHTVYLRY